MRQAWLIGLAVLLLLALAGTAWLYLRRLRRPRRKKPVRIRREAPRHPVVLAHGLFGFDELPLPGGRVEYWRGVPRRLQKMGAKVHVAKVSATGGVEERGRQLAEQLKSIDAKRVSIIAHSMGGVDARWAIAKGGLSDKVAALVTVAAPHRGTPLADASTMMGLVGIKGVVDATREKMRRFNEAVADVPGVDYFSVVGAVASGSPSALLVPAWLWMKASAGANDGIVPAESQRWGEVVEEVDADHWSQIGWGGFPFDAPGLYQRLASLLRRRGH